MIFFMENSTSPGVTLVFCYEAATANGTFASVGSVAYVADSYAVGWAQANFPAANPLLWQRFTFENAAGQGQPSVAIHQAATTILCALAGNVADVFGGVPENCRLRFSIDLELGAPYSGGPPPAVVVNDRDEVIPDIVGAWACYVFRSNYYRVDFLINGAVQSTWRLAVPNAASATFNSTTASRIT